MPFVTTWIDLEGIMLRETSQIEKTNTVCSHTFMWNLKKKEEISQIWRTDWWLPEVGGGGNGVKWKKGVKRYKLSVIK